MIFPPEGIGDFLFRERLVNIPAVWTVIAASSPNRVWLEISNPTSGVINISTVPGPANLVARPYTILPAQSPPYVLRWQFDGAVVSQTWWCFVGANNNVTVRELFYQPQGGGLLQRQSTEIPRAISPQQEQPPLIQPVPAPSSPIRSRPGESQSYYPPHGLTPPQVARLPSKL